MYILQLINPVLDKDIRTNKIALLVLNSLYFYSTKSALSQATAFVDRVDCLQTDSIDLVSEIFRIFGKENLKVDTEEDVEIPNKEFKIF